MSEISANLSLPYLQPAQAQKHVTHNAALRRLDALAQLSVASASTNVPPASPTDGLRYILPAGASGAWSGQDAAVATYETNTWVFDAPRPGWRAWVEDSAALLVWDGTTWTAAVAPPTFQNLDHLGVQTSADATNRLAVAAAATLFTHAGAGHQLKLNKAAAGDTASLLFQTGWSGRAEMGTSGSDDFAIKVSADGSAFQTALTADATTGRVSFPQGVDGLTPAEFGAGPVPTLAYVAARGADLVTNGTGLLGNGYNYPASFTFDAALAPNLPGSVSYAGYYAAPAQMSEPLAVDPNRVYRLGAYLRQEGLAGDWSAYANGERHLQYMGVLCLDADGLTISAAHHMRYRHAGTDSMTTLAAPLSPGDTSVALSDASGWNESDATNTARGLILFGYRNAGGHLYSHYSRLYAFDLFDLGGVNKTTHVVTLNKPFPAALANPDDPSGVWPAGTPLANCSSGATYKYAFFYGLVPPATNQWFRTENHIGGIDLSGLNASGNFPPGTVSVLPFWLPNYTNRSGGYGGHPDTGAAQRIWFAGVSVTPEPLAAMQANADGSVAIKVPVSDYATGSVTLSPAALQVTAL